MAEQIEIKEGRQQGWYWADNSVAREYLLKIGHGPFALYNLLCTYANKEDKCWPSLETLSKTLGRSDDMIIEYEKVLVRFNLIKVDSGKLKGTSNTITILTPQGGSYSSDQVARASVTNNNHINNNVLLRNTLVKDKSSTQTSSSKKKRDINEPMNLKQFIAYCNLKNQRHLHIIADWADTIKPNFKTYGQWDAFMIRNVRPASQLAPFSDEDIQKGYDKMIKMYEKSNWGRYTLETLLKFILD